MVNYYPCPRCEKSMEEKRKDYFECECGYDLYVQGGGD